MLKPSSAFLITLACLLALFHATAAVTATIEKSITSDEIAHLTAGLVYNTRGDFRLHPENGNLSQRLAALPMTLAGVTPPTATGQAWQQSDIWIYSHRFFYSGSLLTEQWTFLGRSMIALVSAATGLLVFFWSRALFGWKGAFLSLTLFVFSPTFLAHGALTTSDAVMTFFFIAANGAWWTHLQRPGLAWGTISAVTVALSFLAKFSAVLLVPMLILTGIVWVVSSYPEQGCKTVLARLGRTTVVHVIVAGCTIWLFYGFRYQAFAPALAEGASFARDWEWTLRGLGLPGKVIEHLRAWRILPEAWLYGLAFVLQFARARGAFLNGEYSITGWASFFPFAFAIKSTLPLLILLTAGCGSALRKIVVRAQNGAAPTLTPFRPLTPLLVLFSLYWATSLSSSLNIGHRHILPTYPILFIAAGWLGRWFDLRRPLTIALTCSLLIWHAADSIRVRPHYLAYFNQIVGGPINGWKHLVDSSLDWGQDLPGLAKWLDAHRRENERVYLSYFGMSEPDYYGIDAVRMPMIHHLQRKRPWYWLEPGIYAISASMLQHVYMPIRGDWTLELEKEYQNFRTSDAAFRALKASPNGHPELFDGVTPEQWARAWERYEQLRFARLCHYLRARGPDDHVGYSILIFRLTDTEIRDATEGSLQMWSEALSRAIKNRRASTSERAASSRS